MKRSLCIAAVMTLVLSACANMGADGGGARTGSCLQAKQHCILVTIYEDTSGTRTIEVDNPEVHVRGQDHVIFWKIINDPRTKDYKFTADGIKFMSDRDKTFNCNPTADSNSFVCVDKGKKEGPPAKYKYVIMVKDGTSKDLTLDPFVVND